MKDESPFCLKWWSVTKY